MMRKLTMILKQGYEEMKKNHIYVPGYGAR